MQPVSPTPAERPLKPKRSQLFQTLSSQKRQPRARASAACEACKKRKTKCTGGPPPCQICESRGTGCVIDLSLDLRRRSALKHAQDQCKSYQDTLEGFIDCIRQGPSSLLDTLFESIENAATTKDAVKTIQPHLLVVRSGKYDQAGPCQPEVMTSQNDSGDMDSFQGQVNELSDRAEYKLETTASLISTPQTPGKDAHIEYSAQISDLPEQLKTPISSDIALPGRTDYSQRYPALQMSSHVNPTADQVPIIQESSGRRFSEAGTASIPPDDSYISSLSAEYVPGTQETGIPPSDFLELFINVNVLSTGVTPASGNARWMLSFP